jgi:hypothetical protein
LRTRYLLASLARALMHDRPRARTEQLISERIDDELVIYDQLGHVAHCLSREAVRVWEQCDGRLTEAEIADRLTVSIEVVERAVAALEERGLLDEGPAVAPDYSRRQAAVRLARIGGAVLAGPLVYSIDVGSAAAAASHLAAGCPVTACAGVASCPGSSANGTNSTCASGRCYCSTVNSAGTTQNQLRCAISSSCSIDNTACTSNGECCGNNCPTAAPRRCRSASPSC